MCSTGGMPTASQTSRKPGAGLLQRRLGRQQPGLGAGDGGAAGLEHQHVALDQLLGQALTWESSVFTLGLLQPTMPTTPWMRPWMMASFSGRKVLRKRPPSM